MLLGLVFNLSSSTLLLLPFFNKLLSFPVYLDLLFPRLFLYLDLVFTPYTLACPFNTL
jgi:hypothetical protein